MVLYPESGLVGRKKSGRSEHLVWSKLVLDVLGLELKKGQVKLLKMSCFSLYWPQLAIQKAGYRVITVWQGIWGSRVSFRLVPLTYGRSLCTFCVEQRRCLDMFKLRSS